MVLYSCLLTDISSCGGFKAERRGEQLSSKWDDFGFRMRNEMRDTSEQAIKVGLDHVCVGSRLNPSLHVICIGRAGKEKNRRVRVEGTHPATQFKSIEIRQPCVEQVQVEPFCLNRRQGLGGGSHCCGFNQCEL